jgi:DNA-binding transcriptional ArsR family regulator
VRNVVPNYEDKAELFHLLSLENRLRILDELRYGDACVCHLQHHLGRPQAYVSQQLRVLKDAGVVDDHKDGVNVFYSLTSPTARELLEVALGPIDADRPVDPSCPCPRCAEEVGVCVGCEVRQDA